MRIFLIGLPGSGKTTLGKQLAVGLKYEFIDMDDVIVEEEGKSINEIFSQNGEDYFRKKENEVLKKLILEDNIVVSTGGGVPCFFDNIDLINNGGVSIFLDVPPKSITKRLMSQKTENRPLVNGKSEQELLEFLEKKREERFPFYSKAKLVIGGEKITVALLMEEVRRSS